MRVALSKEDNTLLSAMRQKKRRQMPPRLTPMVWVYTRLRVREPRKTSEHRLQATMEYATRLRAVLGTEYGIAEPLIDSAGRIKRQFDRRPYGMALIRQAQYGDHVVVSSMDVLSHAGDVPAVIATYWLDRGITPHFVAENIDFSSPVEATRLLAAIADAYTAIQSEKAILRRPAPPRIPPSKRAQYAHSRYIRSPRMDHSATWKLRVEIFLLRIRWGWSPHRISDWIEEREAAFEGKRAKPRHQRRWTPKACSNTLMRTWFFWDGSQEFAEQLDALKSVPPYLLYDAIPPCPVEQGTPLKFVSAE